MSEATMRSRINKVLPFLAAAIFLAATASSSQARFAQQDQQSNQTPPAVAEDPIEQLGLTPEQRQRIRMIVAENKDERQMTNRRVREANVALDQALDAETIDENLIEQRVNDLTAAQAAQLRMRIRTETRIRRELRPEQLATLRRLRLQVRDVMGGQRPLNRRAIRQGLRQNQRNRTLPRRNIP
jgi:Spy/CpxP family protein refolding chaperone